MKCATIASGKNPGQREISTSYPQGKCETMEAPPQGLYSYILKKGNTVNA